MAKPKRTSQKQSSGKVRHSRSATQSDTPRRPPVAWSEVIVWGLLFARWLMPTEGTAEGDTLWLTSLTLAGAAGFCWWKSRVSPDRLRFEKLDVTVWMLCGAHMLSALVVILTEGNKRAATNMLWEWLAVAVTFSLLRQTLTLQSRPRFLQAIVACVTALACYGIWQPTFWYPANLREYQELTAEIDSVEALTELSSVEKTRKQQELRARLVSAGIPLHGPARQLFENRLMDSKEPLGFFALTNSFASLMTIALVLLAGTLIDLLLTGRSRNSPEEIKGSSNRKIICLLAASLLIVTYCLVLTKSRSAWGGTAVGLVTLLGLFVIRSESGAVLRKLLPILAVSVVAVLLITGVAIATDALDIEVLTEASVSLSYRLEYWTASWNVILDHPLFGTGPGNFRNHYLLHKLPQSSEEIADPHQFVLDVTANAGFVGLFGLVAFSGIVGWHCWRLCRQNDKPLPGDLVGISARDQPSIRSAIACAAGITFAGEWLFSGTVSWSVLSVCILAAMISSLIGYIMRSSENSAPAEQHLHVPPIAVAATLVAMFVHLSAAGGIAMPGIIGAILALAAVLSLDVTAESIVRHGYCNEHAEPDNVSSSDMSAGSANEQFQTGTWLASALLSGLAAVGCTTTAFSPVIQATSLLQLGDYEAINGQPVRQVVSVYKSAAEADPLSSEPYIRLSQIYLHQWKQTRDETSFEQAIKAAETACSLSPHSPQAAHELGFAWFVRAQNVSSKNDEANSRAATELQNALAMYPTNPTWVAQTAQALALNGDNEKAAVLARRALEFDEMNRNAGHVDRYLPDDLLLAVRQLAIE